MNFDCSQYLNQLVFIVRPMKQSEEREGAMERGEGLGNLGNMGNMSNMGKHDMKSNDIKLTALGLWRNTSPTGILREIWLFNQFLRSFVYEKKFSWTYSE